MNQLYTVLLTIHITSGVMVLLTALLSVLNKTLDLPHKAHVFTGVAFVVGMCSISVTALSLTLIKPSPFLTLVALFSTYLTLSGWRYAKNRSGNPQIEDWALVGLGLVSALGMLTWGVWGLGNGSSFAIVALVFGLVLGFLASLDVQLLRVGGAKGKNRIAQHLTLMLAATIGAITAFSVNVIRGVEPGWLLWLAPTVLLVPLIILWRRKIRGGFSVRGM